MNKEPIQDLLTDGLELVIDQLTDNPLVQDIPVIGTIVKSFETIASIRDRLFIQHLYSFITATGDLLASEKIKEFSNSEDAERISNKLVQVISLISDREKPEIIACLFASRVNQNLSTLEFLRAVDIVQSTFIEDIVGFIHLNQVVDCSFEELEQYGIENLVNTALIHQDFVDNEELIRSGREDEIGISKYTQSNFGYKFRQACHSGAIQRKTSA